jgi:adenine-specific DNA-methyltransferase
VVAATRGALIAREYSDTARVTLYSGDRLTFLGQLPEKAARLIVTSPPYNIGKSYEKRSSVERYLEDQRATIAACVRALADDGSICWQVGNYVEGQEIFPLDTLLYPIFKNHGLKLHNRIVWHFEHGLNCQRRFSGRYETILWFTRSDNYVFNLDPVRVPQKYPGKKAFKGPRKGEYTSNPLGKNPGDLWVIPNVKHNHPEKTIHGSQFPVELIERLVLALTNEGDLVVDPYIGVGTTAVASILHDRRAAGSDKEARFIDVARSRIKSAAEGKLKVRPMGRPVYTPNGSVARNPFAKTAS